MGRFELPCQRNSPILLFCSAPVCLPVKWFTLMHRHLFRIQLPAFTSLFAPISFNQRHHWWKCQETLIYPSTVFHQTLPNEELIYTRNCFANPPPLKEFLILPFILMVLTLTQWMSVPLNWSLANYSNNPPAKHKSKDIFINLLRHETMDGCCRFTYIFQTCLTCAPPLLPPVYNWSGNDQPTASTMTISTKKQQER